MLATCLRRLLPHIAVDDVVLTGGVALAIHVPGSRDRVADVDFVARTPEAVRPTVTAELLVSHHHVATKWRLELVDPVSRLRLDFFPDLTGSVARAEIHEVAGARLRVIARADLLAHKLQTVQKGPVEPKHVRDALLLGGRPPLVVSVADAVYGQDVDAICARCRDSLDPAFPLAPKPQILEILGYV